jgi:HK97 family phage portal protein
MANLLTRILPKSLQVQGKSLEKRNSSSLIAPAQWFIDSLANLFGSQTQSGQPVTPETAMSIAAVKRCVGIIADNISVLSLKLYESTATDGRVRLFDDVAIRVLQNPNSYQTSFDFMNYLGICLAFRGNAYAQIVRDSAYRPIELHPLNPDRCEVFYSPETRGLRFTVNGVEVPYDDILHLKVFCSDNPYKGKSPIQQHAETLGITLAATNSQAKLYKTGVLKFFIKSDRKIDDPIQKSNLKESLQDVINGQDLSAVLPTGIQLEKISMTPQEAQFIESKKYNDEDIARIFGVPASMIGAGNGGVKSSTEQEYQYFYQSTLLAYSVNIEQSLKKSLIPEAEKPKKYFKFSYNSLMRATAQERADYYNKGIRGGWLTPNEARIYEDMKTEDGLDSFYVEANLMPADKMAEYIDAKIKQLEAAAIGNNPEGTNQNPTS